MRIALARVCQCGGVLFILRAVDKSGSAAPYHFELVVGDRDLSIYVTDTSAKPVATKGAKATAIVLTNKKPVRMTLNPLGTNELKGRGSFASASDMKLVFSLILPGKKPLMARFASRR